jgi:trehalose 6-phosphate phosphatase
LPSDAALFLDLDGTLIDFAERPEAIVVEAELRALLAGLARRLDGRLAILSGRSLADLDSHLGLTGLAMGGSHGLERRHADGRTDPFAPHPALAAATAEAAAFAASHGVTLEAKTASVALHYRAAPHAEADVAAFAEQAARRHGLIVQSGAMVCEIRPAGRTKGDVVRAFMAEQPFASGSPVMVGDDLTDEHAFAAALALGGTAVLVGRQRDSLAPWRLPDVAAVRRWLMGDA